MVIAIGWWLCTFKKPLWAIPELVEELMEPAGILLLFAGVMGRAFSTITIGGRKDKELVTTEIYSTVRHPLYFFSFLFMIGIGLLIRRPEIMMYLMAAYLAVFIPMMKNEEKYLTAKFGEQYTAYAKTVPFFIPDFRLYTARERIETNPRLIGRTLLEASLVLIFIPLMEILDILRKLM